MNCLKGCLVKFNDNLGMQKIENQRGKIRQIKLIGAANICRDYPGKICTHVYVKKLAAKKKLRFDLS